MANIIVPQRKVWTRQPRNSRGVALDSVSLAWNGFNGVDASGNAQLKPVITSGTISRAITPYGEGWKQDAAASFNTTKTAIPNGDFTAIFSGTEGTSNTQPQFAIKQVNGSSIIAIGLNFNDYFSAAAGRVSLTMLQSGVNRSHAYVASVTGSGNAHRTYLFRKKGTTVECWINGVKQSVTSSGGFTGAPAGSADSLYVCGDSTDGGKRWSGTNYDGVLIHASVVKYALPDVLCQSLSRSDGQWQIFARRDRRIIIDFGASGGVTISTTPALATANGIQAQVATAITVNSNLANALASGIATSISSGVTINTGIASGIGVGTAAVVSSATSISASVAAAAATGAGATISTDSGIVNCGVGIGASSSLVAKVSSDIIVSTGVGTVAASGIASTVTTSQSISCAIAAASGSGQSTNVISDISIATGYAHGSGYGLVAEIVEQEIVPLTQEQLDQALAYIKANPMIMTIPKYIALKDAF